MSTQNFYHNHPIQQTTQELNVMREFLQSHTIGRVIELGTGFGTSAMFLCEYSPIVFTFDNKDLRVKESKTYSSRIVYCQANIFDSMIQRFIALLMDTKEQLLLFCDNGNKAAEFNLFSKFLPKGAFIFLHDFNVEFKLSDLQLNGFEILHRGVNDRLLLLKKEG